MLNNNSKIALIPAYNPDNKLTGVIKGLKDHGYTVVLVNDGSDKTFDYLFDKSNGADAVVTHSENKGKGIALKTGLSWIYKNCTQPYTVVTVDADGQHLISDTLRVSAAAKRCPSTLIIGSRRLKNDAPFRSKSGNFITRVFLNTLTPVKIYDTQSGLRGFTHDLIPVLTKIPGSRYEYEMQMLIDVDREGIPIREVPIEAVYIGDNGTSHFRTVYDSTRLYKVIFRNAGKRKEKRR